jgi:hypothetical protein
MEPARAQRLLPKLADGGMVFCCTGFEVDRWNQWLDAGVN